MRHKLLVSFFGTFETFDIANFFSVKIALAAPKIMYLCTFSEYFSIPFSTGVQ